MPFDTNGTFNRLHNWKADAASNVKIRADRHDDEDDGFASGLSNCITKDGHTQPTADIPMNGRHIINLGEPRDGQPQDAATKNYVDMHKDFTTGVGINGAGPINGFINFMSPVGVNGIGWATADMSWIGRIAEAGKWRNRLAVNDKPDGTGTDVVSVDEGGAINSAIGTITHNLYYDGTNWRTPVAGFGTALTFNSSALSLYTHDTLATTNPNQSIVTRQAFSVASNDGSVTMTLNRSASGKGVSIYGATAGAQRWSMHLGTGEAESATRTGTNFYLVSYDNTGASPVNEIVINRENHNLYTTGQIVSGASTFTGGGVNVVLQGSGAAAGSVYLRPNGPADNATATIVDSLGQLLVCGGTNGGVSGGVLAGRGLMGKAGGQYGSYDGYYHNLYYSGGFEYVYVNDTLMGAITWQSDYRIKRNIQPLPTMWNRVKALNPIRYQHGTFKDLVKNEDTVRWGLIAHEVQDALIKSAAIGDKDEDNVIQSLNPLTLIAVLTKALQEAMTRIEALEAKP